MATEDETRAPDDAAVGATTPPLDAAAPIEGRERTANPFSPRRLTSVPAITGAGLAIGALLALVLGFVLVVMPANGDHRSAMAETRADLAARLTDVVARDLRGTVRQIAIAPETARALRSGDPDQIRALEEQFRSSVDGVLRVRINGAGEADIALTEVPPLTFAGLDLIRDAENAELSGPEFLATEAGPVLNVAAAVPSGGPRAAGTVMLTLDARVLRGAFASLPESAGYFALMQTFSDNDPVPVAEVGPMPASRDGEVQVQLTTRNWSIHHVPAAGTSLVSPLALLPGVLLLAIVAAGALVFSWRRARGSLRADLERLVDSAGALALGRSPTATREYDLDETAAAGGALVTLAGEIEVTGKRRGPAVPQVAAPVAAPEAAETEAPSAAPAALPELDDAPLLPDDDEFLAMDDDEPAEAPAAVTVSAEDVPPSVIFRDYDIRGIVGEQLTETHAEVIGRAIGSAVLDAGEQEIAVAGDVRTSTPVLKAALVEGLRASGVDVVDLGSVPTPVLYHTAWTTGVRSGVIVTGSHNAPEYNGFKIVIGGETLASGRIAELRERIAEGRLASGDGSLREEDAVARYVDEIAGDIALAQPLRVVVDCGNGVAGQVMPRLLEALGCEVMPLYCDPDGSFPNHHPDPADPKNLDDLQTVVRAEGADLGIALDGDGDRLGAVDEQGQIIWPDRLMMLFARDIVGRNPGADVIFDVKCSRHLNALVSEYGGRPIMWKTGHAHLKAKMRETGALLGGELSGHISFGERWHGFDDGLYSAARLIEIIAGEAMPASEVFQAFPPAVATAEIRVPVDDARKFDIVDALVESGDLDTGDVSTIDGLRVDYPDGWGLVRASNTAPEITLRFEADSAGVIHEIVDQFKTALRKVDPKIDFTIDV